MEIGAEHEGFHRPAVRVPLALIAGFVALTAFGGGAALVLGSVEPSLGSVLVPPVEYLEGSPFASYLVPGLALGIVLGGLHLVALVLVLRRHRWAHLASAAAGFDALIWIFVQMVVIPFSALQAVYFAAGLAELGLVLLGLGVLRPITSRRAGASRGDR